MTDLEIAFVIVLLLVAIWLQLRIRAVNRTIQRQTEELLGHYQKQVQAMARTGVVNGTYQKANEVAVENRPAGKQTGVVKPKTPRQLEIETNVRMQQASEKWGLEEK